MMNESRDVDIKLNPDMIFLDDPFVLIRKCKVRKMGKNDASIETTIPKAVFEREMRILGVDMEDIKDKIYAVWRYGPFKGLHLSFELRE